MFDIIFLGILVLCTWQGYKRGILSGIIGILVIIVALFIGNLISVTCSTEFSPMIKSFMSGYVDTQLIEAKDDLKNQDYTNYSVEDVLEVNPKVAKELSAAAFVNIGVTEVSANKLAAQALEERENNSGTLSNAIATVLSITLAYLLVLCVAVILIIIIFTVVANITNIKPRLPVKQSLDSSMGGVIGLIRGILIVSVIAWVIGFLGFAIKPETVEKTVLTELFVKHNIISLIVGI